MQTGDKAACFKVNIYDKQPSHKLMHICSRLLVLSFTKLVRLTSKLNEARHSFHMLLSGLPNNSHYSLPLKSFSQSCIISWISFIVAASKTLFANCRIDAIS